MFNKVALQRLGFFRVSDGNVKKELTYVELAIVLWVLLDLDWKNKAHGLILVNCTNWQLVNTSCRKCYVQQYIWLLHMLNLLYDGICSSTLLNMVSILPMVFLNFTSNAELTSFSLYKNHSGLISILSSTCNIVSVDGELLPLKQNWHRYARPIHIDSRNMMFQVCQGPTETRYLYFIQWFHHSHFHVWIKTHSFSCLT